jgi:hypothetical protein
VLHTAISKPGLILHQPHSLFQELIMTERAVHDELVAALIRATFVTPQSGLAHKAIVDSSGSAAVAAAEPMKIVPADVLATGASWSPLTGDGSN